MKKVQGKENRHVDIAHNKPRLKHHAQPKVYDTAYLQYSTGKESHNMIRPIAKTTLTHKPSKRVLELACPKSPYFTYCGKENFRFIKRDYPAIWDSKVAGPEDLIALMPIQKQIEVTRPTMTSFTSSQQKKNTAKEPQLITFLPEPEKKKATCSKRLCVLAQPRQNRMELRQKQLEEENRVYTISKSAMRAIPSKRIVELARPKTAHYSENRSRKDMLIISLGADNKKQQKPQIRYPHKRAKRKQEHTTTALNKRNYLDVNKDSGKSLKKDASMPNSGQKKRDSSNSIHVRNSEIQSNISDVHKTSYVGNDLRLIPHFDQNYYNASEEKARRKNSKLRAIENDMERKQKTKVTEDMHQHSELSTTYSSFTESSDFSSQEMEYETVWTIEEITVSSEVSFSESNFKSLSTTEDEMKNTCQCTKNENLSSAEIVLAKDSLKIKRRNLIGVADHNKNDGEKVKTNKIKDLVDEIYSAALERITSSDVSAEQTAVISPTTEEISIESIEKDQNNKEKYVQSRFENKKLSNAKEDSTTSYIPAEQDGLVMKKQHIIKETKYLTTDKQYEELTNTSASSATKNYLDDLDIKRTEDEKSIIQDSLSSLSSECINVISIQEKEKEANETKDENLQSVRIKSSNSSKDQQTQQKPFIELDVRKLSYLTIPPIVILENPIYDSKFPSLDKNDK